MGDRHEQAYGEGRRDAEEGNPDRTERGALETGALAASGIGLILDGILPPTSPTTEQQSYKAGREDAQDDD